MISDRFGSERIPLVDEETGRALWRITYSQKEDKHAYYDICPWNTEQKNIVFSSADSQDLTIEWEGTLASKNGELYIMNTETFEIRKLADNAFFNTHTGVWALWHPDGRSVYFLQAPGTLAVMDMSTQHIIRYMENVARQLAPDGKEFVSSSNDPEWKDGGGVYTMSEEGSDINRIASTKELYDLTPNRKKFKLNDMTISNTKWHPDSTHILVAMCAFHKGIRMNVKRNLYIVSKDGSEKRWLSHFDHHHCWTPNGNRVLYCDWNERKKPRLYLINFDGSDRHVVIEEDLEGHPSMSPSSKMIVTEDFYGIRLVDINEQTVELLHAFKGGAFDMSHHGTHPHCVWSPDGTQILFNSAETGNSQIYIIHIN